MVRLLSDRDPATPHAHEDRAGSAGLRSWEHEWERDLRYPWLAPIDRKTPPEPSLPPGVRGHGVEVADPVLLVVDPMRRGGDDRRRGDVGRVARRHPARRREPRIGAPREPDRLLVLVLRLLVVRGAVPFQVVAEAGIPRGVEVEAVPRVEHAVPLSGHGDGAFAEGVGSRVHHHALRKIPGGRAEDPEGSGIDARDRNPRRGEIGRAQDVEPRTQDPEPHPGARGLQAQGSCVDGAPERRATGRGRERGAIDLWAAASSPRGFGEPGPGNIQRDLLDRGRRARARIPPDRAERHLDHALFSGGGLHDAQKRQLHGPGEPPAVRGALQEGGELGGADGWPSRRIGDEVRKRLGKEASQGALPLGARRHGGLDAPGNVKEEGEHGKRRRARRGVERPARDRDLRQPLAEEVPERHLGRGDGEQDAIAGGGHRFDARSERDGSFHPRRRAGGAPREQRSEKDKDPSGVTQALVIRSASSINMTGMSSTMG